MFLLKYRRRHQINLRLSSLVNHRLQKPPEQPDRVFLGKTETLGSFGSFRRMFVVNAVAFMKVFGSGACGGGPFGTPTEREPGSTSPVPASRASSDQVLCPTRHRPVGQKCRFGPGAGGLDRTPEKPDPPSSNICLAATLKPRPLPGHLH